MGDNGNTGIRVCEGRKIPKVIVDKIQQRNALDKEFADLVIVIGEV